MSVDDGASPGQVDVSVVVCTRDRAERLRRTVDAVVASLGHARDVEGLTCELVVVDNASTDATPQVIATAMTADPRVRGVVASEPGIAHARNRGLEEARGGVLLFTDDDVLVPVDWVATLSRPLREGRADALAGGVRMARDLERPWMTADLRSKYYADVPVPPEVNPCLAGANMGMTRHVADTFRFDDQLGTPRYPGGEDVLFYLQILEAGLRVRGVVDASVEHHFDPARLEAQRLERIAEGYGRCDAFLLYHWLHARLRAQRLRVLVHRVALGARWLVARGNRYDAHVLQLRREVSFHREMLALRGTPHRYAYRALRPAAEGSLADG